MAPIENIPLNIKK